MAAAATLEKTAKSSSGAELLEREGLSAFHRNAFSQALDFYRRASSLFLESKNIERHLELIIKVLRLLAEKEEFAEIAVVQAHVDRLLAKGELSELLKSRVYYILGVCDSFQAIRAQKASEQFSRSIESALKAGDKKALAYPVYGCAFLSYGNGDYAQVRLQLDRLKLLLEHTPNSDLAIGASILRGLLARDEGQFGFAMEMMWLAYRELQTSPNMILYVHAVHGLGSVSLRQGDINSAHNFIQLAESAFQVCELPRLANMIAHTRKLIEAARPKASEDFRLDCERGLIFDRRNQIIQLQGQFVLRDLAKLFFQMPSKPYSKVEIVSAIWGENYDPSIHDNRIYVTIRRLRRLLEKDEKCDVSVIVRNKGGYQLNPTLKVCVV